MNILNLIYILLVFGIIIAFHEFGHFVMAKKNGILVKEFAIGMGPTLWSTKKKETKYSLKALPIGGYCLMLGEDEESEDENAFSNKSVWARMSVVLAGPVFNFILAFVFSIVLISIVGFDAANINAVNKDSAAYEAGIKAGDEIISMDGKRIYNYREVLVYMQFHQTGEPMDITVDREGNRINYTITPKKSENGVYQIGVTGGVREKGNAIATIKYAGLELRYWVVTTFESLKQLFTGRIGIDSLSGPVGIGKMMNDTIEEANDTGGAIDVVLNIVNFCILLSANLGVMNLLPIPALDGGRFLFLIIEAVRRKKVSVNVEAVVNVVGFVLIMLLMVFVMFNDVKNVFF